MMAAGQKHDEKADRVIAFNESKNHDEFLPICMTDYWSRRTSRSKGAQFTTVGL